jgi:cobalt-zinc-cadmium efflux system outer membrane protein
VRGAGGQLQPKGSAALGVRPAGESAAVLSVLADAKHAFYNALRQREEIQHAQENLQLVEDLRRRVEVEVQTGEKGRLELTRAEAELARDFRYAARSSNMPMQLRICELQLPLRRMQISTRRGSLSREHRCRRSSNCGAKCWIRIR